METVAEFCWKITSLENLLLQLFTIFSRSMVSNEMNNGILVLRSNVVLSILSESLRICLQKTLLNMKLFFRERECFRFFNLYLRCHSVQFLILSNLFKNRR
jgi:hypothetical protein